MRKLQGLPEERKPRFRTRKRNLAFLSLVTDLEGSKKDYSATPVSERVDALLGFPTWALEVRTWNCLSFAAGSENSHRAFPFNDLHDAVDAREGNFLTHAAGPEDFDLVDLGRGAEAEVDANVGRGGVAAAAEDVAALADAASRHEDFRANGVSRGTLSGFLGR